MRTQNSSLLQSLDLRFALLGRAVSCFSAVSCSHALQAHQGPKASRSEKDPSKAGPAASKPTANGAKPTANGAAPAPAAASAPSMPQSLGMGSIAAMAAAAGQSSMSWPDDCPCLERSSCMQCLACISNCRLEQAVKAFPGCMTHD